MKGGTGKEGGGIEREEEGRERGREGGRKGGWEGGREDEGREIRTGQMRQ